MTLLVAFVVSTILVPAEAVPVRAPTLAEDFARPPLARGALAWWHWCDGNVSKAGITRDLEAMKRAGLAGATVFHGCFGPRNQLQESFVYHSENWWDHLAFASREAKRLGLVLGMQNCPGYSASGPGLFPAEGVARKYFSPNVFGGLVKNRDKLSRRNRD